MKRIYLIDCPGIVHPSPNDTETDIILKGVIRVENLTQPEQHIPVLMERVHTPYLQQTYGITSWEDSNDFLEQLAMKSGRLLKGGEPDVSSVAKMVLNDWIRGRIPFFSRPPMSDDFVSAEEKEKDGAEEDSKEDVVIEEQALDDIQVSSAFLAEDLEAPTELTKDETEEQGWDDVFAGEKAGSEIDSELEFSDLSSEEEDDEESAPVNAKTTKSRPSPKGLPEFKVSSVTESESDDKRKKTNKRKVGFNFYENVNIKNKSRKTTKVVAPEQQIAKMRKPGTTRIKK